MPHATNPIKPRGTKIAKERFQFTLRALVFPIQPHRTLPSLRSSARYLSYCIRLRVMHEPATVIGDRYDDLVPARGHLRQARR